MTPQEAAERFARVKLGGAEAAVVLLLLFGPRTLREIHATLPHHRDTIHEALRSLEGRGFIRYPAGKYRRKCPVELAAALHATPKPDTRDLARLRKPDSAEPVTLEKLAPEQQNALARALGAPWALVMGSKILREKAEDLARVMFAG